MALLSASLLSSDFYALGKDIENAQICGADWIHFDVMDSHFVPPLSFGSKILADIKKHNNVFCDVHLMVDKPDKHVPEFINAGADLVNIHYETALHGDRLINLIKNNNKKAGITINPTTPVSVLEFYLPLVDLVLIMTVNPGYAGQACIEYNFEKIQQLKNIREQKNYNYLIQIDGCMKLETVDKALAKGADVIVSGSGFFGVPDEKKKKLSSLIHEHRQ